MWDGCLGRLLRTIISQHCRRLPEARNHCWPARLLTAALVAWLERLQRGLERRCLERARWLYWHDGARPAVVGGRHGGALERLTERSVVVYRRVHPVGEMGVTAVFSRSLLSNCGVQTLVEAGGGTRALVRA